ncbi:MarR family transcriptional regulator [Mediterraneibacter sp. NSJ-55]|uniref:MarR family transcriptional regulator n=1 Tax=Mediterraneibacter hominis TaxID=2763054 RepID=A0A923LEU0_9FIRM|nr:MarR family transcriptional regulator [Mediterraneibacter hominis]MBC5687382.1 MarR family transcriptional regulator [Mediterraneibacter hominis]
MIEENKKIFLRHISTIQRNSQKYLDICLGESIGCGQQYFLAYIAENDGITMYDLAKAGNFDKGTVTKAVQKLVDMEYVVIKTDEMDRRVKHLHVTRKALPVVELIYQTRNEWKEALLSDFAPGEEDRFVRQLEQMAHTSCQVLKEKARQKGTKEKGKEEMQRKGGKEYGE